MPIIHRDSAGVESTKPHTQTHAKTLSTTFDPNEMFIIYICENPSIRLLTISNRNSCSVVRSLLQCGLFTLQCTHCTVQTSHCKQYHH